jgi:protein-S-isoprenylcysteine O-methyltransferase Ste14
MARKKGIYRTGTRKVLSIGFAAILLLLLLFTRASPLLQLPAVNALGLIGLLLAALGAFGRVWSSIYIEGHKNKEIVDQGPYSVTRNPLYLFSLIGAAGLGLASCNPAVLLLLLAAYLLYYPGVISREEKKLRAKHGAAFEEYLARVPRILPRFSLFRQPEEITVRPGSLNRAFGDAIWFIAGYAALRAVVWLHAFNILPALEIPLF